MKTSLLNNRMRKNIQTNSLVAAVLMAATLSACSSDHTQKTTENTVKVKTYTPVSSKEEGVSLGGMITARQTAVISTRVMGYVDKVYVKQGDAVKKGQRLMSINSNDLMAKKAQAMAMVQEAEKAAANAKRDYERYQNLYAQQSVTDKELENIALHHTSVDAKLQVARHTLREVEAMLAYTDIRAPFDGVVTQRMMDEGSTTNPGMPLLTLEQKGNLSVEASVPEQLIPSLKAGDVVHVLVKSQNLRFDATLSEISPSAARSGGQYAIKASLPADAATQVHPGMYATVVIPNANGHHSDHTTVWIDAASVVKRDQLTGVYVATDSNLAMLRWVRLGKTIDGQVEVLSGLRADERIIRKAHGKLYNGIPVSTVQ